MAPLVASPGGVPRTAPHAPRARLAEDGYFDTVAPRTAKRRPRARGAPRRPATARASSVHGETATDGRARQVSRERPWVGIRAGAMSRRRRKDLYSASSLQFVISSWVSGTPSGPDEDRSNPPRLCWP